MEHTNDRGAIQPGASRTMRSRAETAFDNMCANKINVAIIIIVARALLSVRRSGDRGFEGNSSSEAETAFDSM